MKTRKKEEGVDQMAKYQCEICGFIYDEDEQGVKFDNLPEDWSPRGRTIRSHTRRSLPA